MANCVLGVDLGTSGVKVVAVDKTGELLAEQSYDLSLSQPFPGYSEQHPEDWVKGTSSAISKLISENGIYANEIYGISFSGQMHGLVLLDEKNEVIRPAILWDDTRTTKQCEEIRNTMGERFIDITYNQPLEGFTLPKLLWVKENEPSHWKKARKFLLPKDYVRLRITGEIMTDYTDATGTAMFDANTQEWSTEICEKFEVPEKMCPKIFHSTDLAGTVTEEFARNSGLNSSTKVFLGAADNAAGSLSSGMITSDSVLSSIGTSGVVLKYEGKNKANYNGTLQFEDHVIPETYYSMGVTLAAGDSLNWYKKNFAADISFDQMIEKAVNSPVGANGLLFTPYIMGERAPHTDSSIRGSFIGIDGMHRENDFIRAVLEGITYSFRDIMEIYNDYEHTFDKVISIGGGSKSAFWLQMQADVFNKDVITIKNEQGPGLGAAMIAAVGLSWYSNFNDCSEVYVSFGETYKPIEKNVSKYQKMYSIYKKVYGKTQELSKELLDYRKKALNK